MSSRITEYQRYIEKTAEFHLTKYRQEIEKQKANLVESNLFGYSAPQYPASLAVLLGYRYQQTGDEKFVATVVELLLEYETFKEIFPKKFYENRIEYQNGLPPISDFFDMNAYASAYRYIKSSSQIAAVDRATIEKGIADCANFLFYFPEWGPMNRAMLRAQAYLYSALAIPEHPDAGKWRQMADVLASDSLQRWEAEDATNYHSVWLLSLFNFVENTEEQHFFRSSIPRYYLDYFANLMTPLLSLPDFGDAWWPCDFTRFVPIFEKGAAVYQEPLFKWVANRLWEAYNALHTNDNNLRTARFLIDASCWRDVELGEEAPAGKSRLIMDEIVGKKIVLRNGTSPDSNYLLLNYRDEGDSGYLFKEYMRTTITAEEEKPHHGHSDENSISSLISNQTILLNDAGYRPFLPSGDFGAYRADYFHNRMCVRKNRRWIRLEHERQEQDMFEFLRHSGFFRPVTTKLIDFMTFDKVDMSRTRLEDNELGYVGERTIVYQKEANYYIVFDSVKATRRDVFTLTNLWHTQQIMAQGEQWYDGRINEVKNYKNPGDWQLLVYFPQKHPDRNFGVFDLTRHDQPAKAIYETASSYLYENQLETFVTVLVPHAPDVNPADIVQQFEFMPVDKAPQGAGICRRENGREEHIAVKMDLTMDYSQRTIIPRYEQEKGAFKSGVITTDANFVYTEKKDNHVYWAASYLSLLKYAEKTLHSSRKQSYLMQPSGSEEGLWRPVKWRSWEEKSVAL